MQLENGRAPWDKAGPSRHFADRLHRFNWLGDLRACGPEGERHARGLVAHWVAEFGRWNDFVWRIPVTTDRLWNWLVSGPGVIDPSQANGEVVASLVRQARHLGLSYRECPDPNARVRASIVQILVAFGLNEGDKRISALEAILERDLSEQVLADGGHASRNPERLLNLLLDLQTLDEAYLRVGRETPPHLPKTLSRMAGMLNFLSSADGGLPVMNGGSEGMAEDVETALLAQDVSRSFVFASKSAFQRLSAGKTRILIDTGQAPDGDAALEAHAGCLSFEFEDAGKRIVTSCGSHPDVDTVWRTATRATSAHSTLTLNDTDSAQPLPIRSIGLLGPVGPAGVAAKRREENEQALIDCQHAGYRDGFGFLCRRRIAMHDSGERIDGEDALSRPVSDAPEDPGRVLPFALRFHLHPDVRLTPDGHHLRLIMGDGVEWLFVTSHEARRIDSSIYLGRGRVEKTWQLVLTGEVDTGKAATRTGTVVNWSFIKD